MRIITLSILLFCLLTTSCLCAKTVDPSNFSFFKRGHVTLSSCCTTFEVFGKPVGLSVAHPGGCQLQPPHWVLIVIAEKNGSSPEFRQLVRGEDIVSERVTMTTSLFKVSIWVLSKQRTWLCMKSVPMAVLITGCMLYQPPPLLGYFYPEIWGLGSWLGGRLLACWTQTRGLVSSMKQTPSSLPKASSLLAGDGSSCSCHFLLECGL